MEKKLPVVLDLQVYVRGLPGRSTPSISGNDNFIRTVDTHGGKKSRERSSGTDTKRGCPGDIRGEKYRMSFLERKPGILVGADVAGLNRH